jgi:mRNA-degrading endonuclease YafQ of YafQ-DinJ toxin-antitoxin module
MQYKWLHREIELYLDRLSEPQPLWNGWAICPWIKTYRKDIGITIVNRGIKYPLMNAMEMLRPLKYKAIVCAFPVKPKSGAITNTCDYLINLPQFNHIECLQINHKLTGEFKGIYTGFIHCDLVIIQDRDLLAQSRQKLKKQGYYKAQSQYQNK